MYFSNQDFEEIELPRPIKFLFMLDGKKLQATITHEIDHPLYPTFRLAFSNGYEGIFQPLENEKQWEELGVKDSVYGYALADDLTALAGIDLTTKEVFPIWIKQKAEQVYFNVWVLPDIGYMRPDSEYFSVYYKGDFRFHVSKDGLTVGTLERHKGYINESLANIVRENIAKRSLASS